MSLYDQLQGKNMSEKDLQIALIEWFRVVYSNCLIVGNYKNGLQLYSSKGKKPFHLLREIEKLEGNMKGYPDIFIPKPLGKYHGLFIELKKEQSQAFTKEYRESKYTLDFDPTKHFSKNKAEVDRARLQFEYGLRLKAEGYFWSFGIGLDHTKTVITKYFLGDK